MERVQKRAKGGILFSISSFLFFFNVVTILWLFVGDDERWLVCGGQAQRRSDHKLLLEAGFYGGSCPEAEMVVRSVVTSHFHSDATLPAALLRLHFHDCFVRGCDGSILIDGSNVEKTAPDNIGLRGFEVIEDAKAAVERQCPSVVSCADILAIAARDAVVFSGGPSWVVPLGRRDGRVSLASDVDGMPSAQDSISTLKKKFAAKGLSTQDLVILNGAHTIGEVECRFFVHRLYNYSGTGGSDPSMDGGLGETLRGRCPQGGDGFKEVALDAGSQTQFDTSFFSNLLRGYGVLDTDQSLLSDPTTSYHVRAYAAGSLSFHADFPASIIKMSNLHVLTGSDGEIRAACSSFNH